MTKKCQSCGMPLKKDSLRGTEKDRSLNALYCIHCYKAGTFTDPNATAIEMRDFVIHLLHTDMKMPHFLARFFSRGIPKLSRWKK